MGLLRLLLKEYPRLAKAFRDLAIGLAVLVDIDPEAIKRWFPETPQEQPKIFEQHPKLDEKIEALFVTFLQHKDTQFAVEELKRENGKLPALKSEGF